ncbi:hypothetical protein FA95DRAFT_1610031 [Auriscalpium vulgare]|uniref:Uncharacterized protein n=1 Tax=Auriscalpium vulgare TaxID=40419 RepID=A0ACB8RFF3_9AGAM|nr:hypothetical protein FA95DRAFT_1610031 [Auriscalpium vulgare]
MQLSPTPIHPASLTLPHMSSTPSAPQGFFVVTGGRARGILTEWSAVEPLIVQYPNFAFACFATREAANEAWRSACAAQAAAPAAPPATAYCSTHPPAAPAARRMKSNYPYYAVARGCRIGVYTDWNDAYPRVHHHKDAVYKGFHSLQDCINWLNTKLEKL